MTTPIFSATVQSGKLKLDDPEQFYGYIANLAGEVQVIVRKPKKIRSLRENNYYWACVIPPLCEYTGYDPEAMHEALKFKFLRVEQNGIESARSTTDLSTSEFEEYAHRVRVWALQELNVSIPLPNQADY